ncbi:hypothetical protein QEH42_gp191 [Microbacterium phage Pumpernickel]|uniref:Uncharacterized protein n=1 Tax=Microbacterium phage Pumpernickel TaxID=2885983 RepID=A0AAE8Y7W6_9CAUD|nr:hypothetical protein QEH42_gp191 [Microbacterium phage Pumpernickel]UDL16027.1 hypothetical protein SEA_PUMPERNICKEL_277 [Microbacterium phage Pumpernickel]
MNLPEEFPEEDDTRFRIIVGTDYDKHGELFDWQGVEIHRGHYLREEVGEEGPQYKLFLRGSYDEDEITVTEEQMDAIVRGYLRIKRTYGPDGFYSGEGRVDDYGWGR